MRLILALLFTVMGGTAWGQCSTANYPACPGPNGNPVLYNSIKVNPANPIQGDGSALINLPAAGVTAASLGLFPPTNFGPPSGTTALVNNLLPDGGAFGDGLAHPASSNGFTGGSCLTALKAAYSFAVACSDDVAALMIQQAVNAADAAGYGTVPLYLTKNGQFRNLPGGLVMPANTNAILAGGSNNIILSANSGTNPCITINQQNNKTGPVWDLTCYGFNSLVESGFESAGGVAQTSIYNPGTRCLFFKQNSNVVYTHFLGCSNFDMATDWDVSTGGNNLLTFVNFNRYWNNRGTSFQQPANNSFEKITFRDGSSSNNNYGRWEIFQNQTVPISSCTYNNSTGAVSCSTTGVHGLASGALFELASLTGTGAFASLDSTWTATSGTTGSTLNFTAPTGLGTTAITGGSLYAFGTGTSSTFADIQYDNESADYNMVNAEYYLGLGGGDDHINSVYVTGGHIETDTLTSGTGPRILHDGNLDLSQSDWFENGSNIANGAISHIGFFSRTWCNGGKEPGLNTADTGGMPFITGVTFGPGGEGTGCQGLVNRSPAQTVLLTQSNGLTSGFKLYDNSQFVQSGSFTLSLQNQQQPVVLSATGNVTVPLASASNFMIGTVFQIIAAPGATGTLVPASGSVTIATVGTGLTFGGTNGAAIFLTKISTNGWSATGQMTGASGGCSLKLDFSQSCNSQYAMVIH